MSDFLAMIKADLDMTLVNKKIQALNQKTVTLKADLGGTTKSGSKSGGGSNAYNSAFSKVFTTIATESAKTVGHQQRQSINVLTAKEKASIRTTSNKEMISARVNGSIQKATAMEQIKTSAYTERLNIKSNYDKVKAATRAQEKVNTLNNRYATQTGRLETVSGRASEYTAPGYENVAEYQRLTAGIQSAEKARAAYNAEAQKGSAADIDKMTSSYREMTKGITAAEKANEKLISPITDFDKLTTSNKLQKMLNNNTKFDKEATTNLQGLIRDVDSAGTYGEQQRILAEAKTIYAQQENAGRTGNSLLSDIKRGFKNIGQFVGTYRVLQTGVDIAKQMGKAVLDVDTAMVELRKVSDAPSSEITAYFDDAAESAKKYGATISDVINSAADYSRLGYSLSQASMLSDATTLMQKVGDNMTQESASQGIISTLRGFSLDSSEVTRIIDEVNEVAKVLAKLVVIRGAYALLITISVKVLRRIRPRKDLCA